MFLFVLLGWGGVGGLPPVGFLCLDCPTEEGTSCHARIGIVVKDCDGRGAVNQMPGLTDTPPHTRPTTQLFSSKRLSQHWLLNRTRIRASDRQPFLGKERPRKISLPPSGVSLDIYIYILPVPCPLAGSLDTAARALQVLQVAMVSLALCLSAQFYS